MTAEPASPITAVFVYGTLKRGECRAKYWPRPAKSISVATTAGRLHDLGPYPALVPGGERVLGELWRFDADDMPATLRVLDQVEGYGQLGDDYYRRVVVDCETVDGRHVAAYAYEFAQPGDIADAPAIAADAVGHVVWRKPEKHAR